MAGIMQGLAVHCKDLTICSEGNQESLQGLSKRIARYNLLLKRNTLASVLRIDFKRGPSGDDHNSLGEK